MLRAVKLEGSSMSPLFRAGEIALAEAAPPGAARPWLSPGDCAVYEYRGRTLLHRVLSAGPDGAVLGDDAGGIAPHFVPWAGISGRVVSRNPLKKGLPGLAYSGLKRFASALRHAKRS